jgi:hypothetical protein
MHLLIHHPEGFAQDYLQLIDKIIHMNKNKITVRFAHALGDDFTKSFLLEEFAKQGRLISSCCLFLAALESSRIY